MEAALSKSSDGLHTDLRICSNHIKGQSFSNYVYLKLGSLVVGGCQAIGQQS